MLEQLHRERIPVTDFVRCVKDKQQGIRLMGFGHRVYKYFDPRARIVREMCDQLLSKLAITDPLLEIAKELEEVALNDEYFIGRRLYPNVDFYSGVILRAIGIPRSMFPVMFAIGRMPGWIAQWHEERFVARGRLSRPRQLYTGPTQRAYVSIEARVA